MATSADLSIDGVGTERFEAGNAVGRAVEDRWFRYDTMNRVVLDGGQLVDGQVVRGTSGASLTYDAGGQRASSTRNAGLIGQVYVYQENPGGPPYFYDQPAMVDNPNGGQWSLQDAYYGGERRELYGYTADGQLASVQMDQTGYYDDGIGNAVSTGTFDIYGGSGLFAYDATDRQVEQIDRLASGAVAYHQTQVLNAAGQATQSITRRLENGATLVADTYNDYGAYGSQALGLR